jgi:hypothetical protein
MITNVEILESIKTTSLAVKHEVVTFTSVSKIINACTIPTDWNAVAAKCSTNPDHEHYRKSPDEILTIWRTKSTTGANRGNELDDALEYTQVNKSKYDGSFTDDKAANKYNSFYQFYQSNILPHFTHIGAEIWLNSKTLGVNGRLDELMHYTTPTDLIVFDYKNTESIKAENKWKKLRGPLSKLDDCELNKYTLQLYLYKYILEEYGFNVHAVRILQLLENETKPIKPAFGYSKSLIEDIVSFAKTEIQK